MGIQTWVKTKRSDYQKLKGMYTKKRVEKEYRWSRKSE